MPDDGNLAKTGVKRDSPDDEGEERSSRLMIVDTAAWLQYRGPTERIGALLICSHAPFLLFLVRSPTAPTEFFKLMNEKD